MKTDSCYCCKGNALVETTLLMVVMLPLMFGLAMVGDLVDLKQTMEQAARYSSWESTVSTQANDSVSTAKVQERFFMASDQAIASEIQHPSVNAMWGRVDNSMGDMQSESALVLDPSSIQLVVDENVSQPTLAMKIGQAAARSGDILDGVRGNAWGLSYTAPSSVTVEAKLKASAWLPGSDSACSQSGTYVCLNSRAVILDDSWSSSGDTQASQRVRSLMPATVLEPIGNAVSVVGNLPLFQELKDLRGAFGHVDMTVLPEYTGR